MSAEATPAPGRFPLLLISHGSGGSALAYRTLARHLACHGYVVALPEHPGNNRSDNRLQGHDENLSERPRHLHAVIAALGRESWLREHLREQIGLIGHSLGYTALALAGATPWTRSQQRVPVTAEPRVRCLVLLAPAVGWYLPIDSLREVRVPILLWSAQHDTFTPRWRSQLVLDRVPDASRVSYREIANGGHLVAQSVPELDAHSGLPAGYRSDRI